MSPHAQALRAGAKMGDVSLIDTMIKDGLMDVYNGYHMGITAENLAEQYQIGREEQDAFSLRSQTLAAAARDAGRFDAEIAPVTIKGRKGDTVVSKDEFIRDGTTAEALAALRAAFKKDGSVTAGNASGINDGAAALVLMSADEASAARRDRARARRQLGLGRGRPVDHGHRPGPVQPPRTGKGRLENRRPRSDRSQ